MATKGTPQEVADKWASRLAGATADIARGVSRVTVAPGQKAAQKADKWATNTLNAKAKWQRRVGSVSLADWQNAMTTYGAARVATGANAKKNRVADFQAELQPHIDRGQQKLASMPTDTFEQNLARMTAWAQHMHGFVRGGGSSSSGG
jgi:hypothetical protein